MEFSRETWSKSGFRRPCDRIRLSEAILETARHICPDGEFVQGDAQDLPFEDGTFDAIAAAQLFCFLGDVERALLEAYRVLKPGGRIVILDTDWDTLIWRNNIPDLMTRLLAPIRQSMLTRISEVIAAETDSDGLFDCRSR